MKAIPYRKRFNRDNDQVYEFQIQAKTKGFDYYIVEIVIDELDDDIIVKKTCECPSKLRFNKEADCKHIKYCKQLLKEWGVKFRE